MTSFNNTIQSTPVKQLDEYPWVESHTVIPEGVNICQGYDFSRGGGSHFSFPMTELSEEIHTHNDHPITTTSSSLAAMATNSIKLLTGNSHPVLAKAVADQSV
jgi:hypothetical protein